MASKAGTVVKFVGMWLLLPAALAAIGYYVIGPSLGARPSDKPSSTNEERVDEETKTSKSFSEPKIEVSVKKGSTISARDLRPRPRKKPAVKKPVEAAPTPVPPTVDPGGGETVPVSDGTG